MSEHHPDTLKCPHCGMEYASEAAHCPKCGPAGTAETPAEAASTDSEPRAENPQGGGEGKPNARQPLRRWPLTAAAAVTLGLLVLFPVGLGQLGLSWVTGKPWADGLLAASPLAVAVWFWAFRLAKRLKQPGQESPDAAPVAPGWLIALTTLALAPAAPAFLVILYGLLREGPARPLDIARGLAFGLAVFAAAAAVALKRTFDGLDRQKLAKWTLRSLWTTWLVWILAAVFLFADRASFWLTGGVLLALGTLSLALALALRSRGAAGLGVANLVAFLCSVLLLSLTGNVWHVQLLCVGVLALAWWPLRGLSRWGFEPLPLSAMGEEKEGLDRYEDFVQRLDFLSPGLRDNLRTLPNELSRALLPPQAAESDQAPPPRKRGGGGPALLLWEAALLAFCAFWTIGASTEGAGAAWLLLGGLASGGAGGVAASVAVGRRLPKERFTLFLGSSLCCALAAGLAAIAVGTLSPFRFMSAAVWFYSIGLGASLGLAVNRGRGVRMTKESVTGWAVLWFFGGVAAWAAMSALWFAGLFVFFVLGGFVFGVAQGLLTDFVAFLGRVAPPEAVLPPPPPGPQGFSAPPERESLDQEPLELPENFAGQDSDEN